MTSFEYDTGLDGPTVLLLGAVHGNEPGGTLAIQRVLKELGAELNITCGKIIAVPVVNEAARDAGKRFIDKDLNRHLTLDESDTNEGRIAHMLEPLYQQADVVMDLHSFVTEGGEPSVFVDDPSDAALALGQQTLCSYIVVGWQDVFTDHNSKLTGDTLIFAMEHGAIAFTYEGGNHTDPETPNRMYAAIKNCLIGQGMIEGELQHDPNQHTVRMHEAFFMDENPETGNVPTAARHFDHLEFVEEGEPLVMDGDDVIRVAPEGGCYVLFPPSKGENKRQPGEHLMYIGVPESPEFALAAE